MADPIGQNIIFLNPFEGNMKLALSKFWLATLLLILFNSRHANSQALWPEQMGNQVYHHNIKTVRLHLEGLQLSTPIITLNSFEKLHFSFDDLDGDFKTYYYTLVHCDHNWVPSDINAFDFLEGFTEDMITDYAFSFNTLQPYTHYRLQIPNENMKPVAAGNYVIAVFADNDPSTLVLTRQFFVIDPAVDVDGQVKRTSSIRHSATHQEIDFRIIHRNYYISNPFDEIEIMVRQNKRNDNAITGLKPGFIHDEALVYDYETEILFAGGKEFRWFDIQSIRYQKERIKMVEYIADTPHVYIAADGVSSFEKYYYRKDVNGQYFPGIQEGTDDDLEADYVMVHFTLPFKTPLSEGELYVVGGLNEWCTNHCKPMTYNFDRKAYETSIYLKQGYYNYAYAYSSGPQQVNDLEFIEGSSLEAENEYEVFVYHRPFGSRYEKLVGYKVLNSLY